MTLVTFMPTTQKQHKINYFTTKKSKISIKHNNSVQPQ